MGFDSRETNTHTDAGRWSCVEHTGQLAEAAVAKATGAEERSKFSWRFGDILKLGDTPVNATSTKETNKGWPGTGSGGRDTAQGMASDLSGLQRTEKTKVAGLLSKTISGAEVVEIRAVSTTSVMLNACYDL